MLKQPHIYTFLDENSVKLELSPPQYIIPIFSILCVIRPIFCNLLIYIGNYVLL